MQTKMQNVQRAGKEACYEFVSGKMVTCMSTVTNHTLKQQKINGYNVECWTNGDEYSTSHTLQFIGVMKLMENKAETIARIQLRQSAQHISDQDMNVIGRTYPY